MLLQEKMENYPFSASEKTVIAFLLEKKTAIRDYSAKRIADETYTSPSILVRIAQKLNYSGWSEMKKVYLEEIDYLQSHFQSIDANYPFQNQDAIQTIANKIGNLQLESIRDTLSLLGHDELYQATQALLDCQEIKIFAVDNLNYLGQEFAFKMNRIAKKTSIDAISDNLFHEAAMSLPTDCAICLSYSGETPSLLKAVQFLKENGTKIIAITSIGDNRLAQQADIVLRTTTREKSYSKIAGFSSLESMSLLLNILYSCVFAANYEENNRYKLEIAQKIENNRDISNQILADAAILDGDA